MNSHLPHLPSGACGMYVHMATFALLHLSRMPPAEFWSKRTPEMPLFRSEKCVTVYWNPSRSFKFVHWSIHINLSHEEMLEVSPLGLWDPPLPRPCPPPLGKWHTSRSRNQNIEICIRASGFLAQLRTKKKNERLHLTQGNPLTKRAIPWPTIGDPKFKSCVLNQSEHSIHCVSRVIKVKDHALNTEHNQNPVPH